MNDFLYSSWYMYAINQLNSYQNNQNMQNSPALSRSVSTTIEKKTTLDEENIQTQHSTEVKNALRSSLRSISKIQESSNPDNALKESIMSNNKINGKLSEEKKIVDRDKHLKELVTKRLKDMKNEMKKMFMKFFYQGKLLEKNKKKKTLEIDIN